MYFLADDRTMMAVSASSEGGSFRAGRPAELFTMDGDPRGGFSVDVDGSFLAVIQPSAEVGNDGRSVVTFVFNWPTELDRLVP